MRFNNEAYDKIYPRPVEREEVETVVDTFKPTVDEQEDEDGDGADC